MFASRSGQAIAFTLLVVAAGCSAAPPADTAPPRYAAGGGSGSIVGPLKDDSGPDIRSWVDGSPVADWNIEITRRDKAIADYLDDADPAHAAQYGFRSGQNPRLAWDWFRNNPVGFNGLPFVLLKTIVDLDPDDHDPALRTLARIWKHREPAAGGGTAWTLDHIGVEPAPSDYENGVVARRSPLPFGFAFENPTTFAPMNASEMAVADGRLLELRIFKNTSLLIAKVKTTTHEDNWEKDRPTFGSPGTTDRVFFSCAACHVGRVVVDGKMKFLPGMPNGQIEAQYYSKLLMLTAAALTSAGFDPDSPTPVVPDNIKPNTSAVRSLYTALLDKARQHPETLYGSSPADIARAKTQALAIADDFPSVITDLIAVGVKTHFIYKFVARSNAFKAPLPDLFGDRPGQMDAFGIASGLVAIHTRRPDNSYLEFIRRDNPKSPFFTGFSKANGLPEDTAGMTESVTDAKAAADRVLKNVNAWAPQVPAPIDIKSVNWATERYNANWDGNQGASSRTLASGASATGDPRMVNVRIHEPLNPFIDHLPPPPYPFSVDLAKAREGKAIFKEKCASCHSPRNQTIYTAASLGVDSNRSRVNSSVSRYGLAALVMEACTIYGLNHQGQPGADWCMPKGDWNARLDEYFRDTPRRVAQGTNGYKADALHGIWAQAPYLHNGSVPTLGQLLCPSTRPVTFLRGSAQYDPQLVGFEWLRRPERYSPLDTILVKEYDTRVPGKANGGHTFGVELCPDTSALDPIRDREGIVERITASRVRGTVGVSQDPFSSKDQERGSTVVEWSAMIAESILHAIGQTPVIRLRRLVERGNADVLVKLEYYNPTGSYKDRMALAMIEGAEARGELRPGMRVVEYTGGSTGSSLALVCAVKGYRFTAVSSDAFAKEKLDTMRAFGADLRMVASDGGRITPPLFDRMLAEVKRLLEEPDTFWTDQFHNTDAIHGYMGIGRELAEQAGGAIHAFCGAVGTAGMLSGVSQALKAAGCAARIVALEPASAPLLTTGHGGAHRVEGVAPGFVPPHLTPAVYDEARAIDEAEARVMARRLAREEGVFAGTSSALNVVAALQLARELGSGKTVATVAVDSGLKYLAGDLYSGT